MGLVHEIDISGELHRITNGDDEGEAVDYSEMATLESGRKLYGATVDADGVSEHGVFEIVAVPHKVDVEVSFECDDEEEEEGR